MELTLEMLIELKKQGYKLKDCEIVKDYFDYMVEEIIGTKIIPYQGQITKVVDLFNTQPASTKWHQAYEGGLREHCYNVYLNLLDRMSNVKLLPLTISVAEATKIAICHDFCKLTLYYKDENGNYQYDKHIVKRHASLSIDLCWLLGIDLSIGEKSCIRHHMNSFDLPEDYSLESTEEVEWLSDRQNELTLRAVNWADAKENV